MRGNTSIRQRSFPPTRQSMRNATRRTKARGVSNPYRAPRASRGNSITLGSAHPCSRCSLSLSKSPSSIPLSKSSSSISFAPSIRPILESPLVNSAHVFPPHSILQNFLFDQFCAQHTPNLRFTLGGQRFPTWSPAPGGAVSTGLRATNPTYCRWCASGLGPRR